MMGKPRRYNLRRKRRERAKAKKEAELMEAQKAKEDEK